MHRPGGESCEAVLDEIQQIAVRALNEPTMPGDYWHGWLPDAEHFNALRSPLASMFTIRKPALISPATLPRSRFWKETVDALPARIRELESGVQ